MVFFKEHPKAGNYMVIDQDYVSRVVNDAQEPAKLLLIPKLWQKVPKLHYNIPQDHVTRVVNDSQDPDQLLRIMKGPRANLM